MILNFKFWIESIGNNVTIDYSSCDVSIKEELQELFHRIEQNYEEIENFNYENFINNIKGKLSQYSGLGNLLKSLISKNASYIFEEQKKLRTWISSQDINTSMRLREINKQIFTYIDTLSTSAGIEKDKQYLIQKANAAKNETKIVMEKLQSQIQNVISTIEDWSVPQLIIKPYYSRDEFNSLLLEAATSAEVIFDYAHHTTFTVFIHDQLEIDDVLEGGDEDFFKDGNIQSNYFSLIEGLKNPNGVKSKTITLYTARPKKDRSIYLNAKTVPVNIFLVNDFDHALGLSRDLSTGDRDIWKIRINTKYLTQTLDGKIKYYQVTKNNSPIESIELIT